MMNQNSLVAYTNILGTLSKRRMQVYSAIEYLQSASNLDISHFTGLPINCVTGRTKELRDLQVVMEDKKDICPTTNQMVSYWKVVMKLR